MAFGNIDSPHRGPSPAFLAQRLDERGDVLLGHRIHGFVRHPWGRCPGILVNPGIGPQVEGWIEPLSRHVIQRQAAFAAVVDDVQHRFGGSHLTYLAICPSEYLCPLAMWTAFPSSDDYGHSVTLGLASCRRSHASVALYVSHEVGGAFVPF